MIKKGLMNILPGGSARGHVGIFFEKKAGKVKIHLKIDARRVNQRFKPPPRVELCSSEGLARVELEMPEGVSTTSSEGEELLQNATVHLANGDVKDAFHRFRLREELRAWFCFGTVRACDIGMTGAFY